MPKKIKLNLNDLKVQSFVTTLNDWEKNELKGGTTNSWDEDCPQTCMSACITDCAASVCLTTCPSGEPACQAC